MKNETKLDEMIEIMSSLQQYVPALHTFVKQNIQSLQTNEQVGYIIIHLYSVHHFYVPIGEDGYLSPRLVWWRPTYGCKGQRKPKKSSEFRLSSECLQGLMPVAEDWHTKVTLLGVSAMDCTVLFDVRMIYFRLYSSAFIAQHRQGNGEPCTSYVTHQQAKCCEESFQRP